MRCGLHSKTVLSSKLKNTRAVGVADGLTCPEMRVRHQIADLIEGHAITTRGSDGVVLNCIDTRAVLDIKIGAIEHIESLGLEGEGVFFVQTESTRHAEVHLENPRTIKGVEPRGRA